MLHRTALYDEHCKLEAKMVPFAGFEMPLQYSSLKEEHEAVRTKAGMFDVSHMGCFIIRGKEAEDWVNYISSNAVQLLDIGQAQYSCIPNTSGGIVDDMIVYRLEEDQCAEGEKAYMLVVNAANIQKDWDWIHAHKGGRDAGSINISDRTSLLAIQGPAVTGILQKYTDLPLEKIPFYHFRKGSFAGVDNVLISATGYTGSGGFELYVENTYAISLWQTLLAEGIVPCGLGARDTLRLEMGYCLYGNDITDETDPISAGLSWITKLSQKGDFVGRDMIEKVKKNHPSHRLVGLQLDTRRVPRNGYTILNEVQTPIGHITSGTYSPTLSYPIALGYVEREFAKKGKEVHINMGRKTAAATIVSPPFVKIK